MESGKLLLKFITLAFSWPVLLLMIRLLSQPRFVADV